MARTRRSTLAAASRSEGRVARSSAPRRAGGALERFEVRARVARVEHEPIELLDVLAGLENEEVEKTRRGRHAGSDLVCKRVRATKLGRAPGNVHRPTKLAHRRV